MKTKQGTARERANIRATAKKAGRGLLKFKPIQPAPVKLIWGGAR